MNVIQRGIHQWEDSAAELSAFNDVYTSINLESDEETENFFVKEEVIKKEVVKKKEINLSKFKSSAEKNVFSHRHWLWRKYQVFKPRLPIKSDNEFVWIEKYRPCNFDQAKHENNLKAVDCLEKFKEKNWRRPILLVGLSGSGRMTLALILVRNKTNDKILNIQLKKDSQVRDTLEPLLKKKKKKEYAIISGLSKLTGRAQNSLWALVIHYSTSISFVLCADREADLIEKILIGCALIVTIPRPNHAIALEKLLIIATKECVGFDKEGIETIFSLCSTSKITDDDGIDLGRIIAGFQRVFCARHFVSRENVLRELGRDSKIKSPEICAAAILAGDPKYNRCPKCTLKPPCSHLTLEKLSELGLQRRSELPQRNDAMDCEVFVRTGACRFFNKFGHCSLHHPLNAHTVLKPPLKCKLCTLNWPCDLCPYSIYRKALTEAITQIREWAKAQDIPDALRAELAILDALYLVKLDIFLSTSLSTRQADFRSRFFNLQSKLNNTIRKYHQQQSEQQQDASTAEKKENVVLPASPAFLTLNLSLDRRRKVFHHRASSDHDDLDAASSCSSL